ncbi:MAG: hypothetical protein H0X24_01735 [Ktedonobacterales bacterium]|nr:hypothetical protein [Ktedonobacterales bacterium]
MSVTVYELVAQAQATLTEPQRDLLAHLVTTTPHPSQPMVEAPVAPADLRIIATLRARILDEMGRLCTEPERHHALVSRLGTLCMQSLHYVLVETGEPEGITRWVEAALLLLAEVKWIRTPAAQREWFAQEGEA